MPPLYQLKPITDASGFHLRVLLHESWQHWNTSGQSHASYLEYLNFWCRTYKLAPIPAIQCWVVLVGDTAVAMGALNFQEPDFIGFTPRMTDLYVLRAHRGQGYGKLLTTHLLHQAALQGYSQVFLITLPAAAAFHARHGFTWYLQPYNIMVKYCEANEKDYPHGHCQKARKIDQSPHQKAGI